MTIPSQPGHGEPDPALSVIMSERRQLINLAYRLLGSLAEAEDAVQETYARWYAMSAQQQDAIESPGAWLTTVASRICLNLLGSARARRETYVGEWIPEPLPERTEWLTGRPGGTVIDPADRVTLDESVSMAFLVVLESMTPAERVAFILHDVFRFPFAEVAEVVGRSPAACRQLASSARRRIRASQAPVAPAARQAGIVRAFKAAWEARDIDAIIGLLDPDATAVADGGGLAMAFLSPIEGGEQIARAWIEIANRVPGNMAFLECTVNGQPGLVAQQDGITVTVFAFDVAGDRIRRIWVVRNPEKLRSWANRRTSRNAEPPPNITTKPEPRPSLLRRNPGAPARLDADQRADPLILGEPAMVRPALPERAWLAVSKGVPAALTAGFCGERGFTSHSGKRGAMGRARHWWHALMAAGLLANIMLASVPAIAAGSTSPPPSPRQALPAMRPPWAVPPADTGAVPGSTVLDVRVWLAGRDPAALPGYARQVSTPGSPLYRHYLTPAQFGRRFGPTGEQVRAVTGWLADAGLSAISVRAGGEVASGPVNEGACSRYWGQETAGTLPPAYGHLLTYTPCGYLPGQLRAAYQIVRTGLTGRGQTVAIVDTGASPTIAADADRYAHQHGGQPLRPGQLIQYLPAGISRSCAAMGSQPDGYGEETLDVEAAHAMAPDAGIAYVGPAAAPASRASTTCWTPRPASWTAIWPASSATPGTWPPRPGSPRTSSPPSSRSSSRAPPRAPDSTSPPETTATWPPLLPDTSLPCSIRPAIPG